MIGHKLGLRLFLEGVETPVISASISIAADSPTAASIQVIATDKIFNLLPRTVVHLFFYDFVDASYPIAQAEDKSLSPGDLINKQYKLLFMGEVQGISFQKDANSRQVVLQCVDFSNYWDTTYQYNFGGSLLTGYYASFIGANTNLFNSPLGHNQGSIASLFESKSVNFPELKGVLAGIVRCLEAIGGCYYGENTFKGANEFTSIAELRLKILQQITAAEKDTSTAKLFARKVFAQWLNRAIGGLPKLVTFRGVVQVIQQFVFHNIFPCPCPMYVEKQTGLKKPKTFAIDITQDPRARNFIANIRRLLNLFSSAKYILENYGKSSATLDLTPLTVSDTGIKTLQQDLYEALRITKTFKSGGVPNIPGLLKEALQIDSDLTRIGKNLGSLITLTIRFEKLQVAGNRLEAVKYLKDAIEVCNSILGTRVKKTKEITYDKMDRVNNQILRPDIWFAAAPRCNVLFPELYQSFQWSRNYLREVSRLELQTTNEILGDDALFNGRYYAPDISDVRKGKKLSDRQWKHLIMNHELLTGIIPMFEKLSEANLFAMGSNLVTSKGVKVGYAQRSVNHQYFKYRFASRQMGAEGRFNPWFVPGFPSVLIDRPMTSDNLLISGMEVEEGMKALKITPSKDVEITRSTLLQQLVPNQFFGCCTSLSHTVSQQGGSTSYGFEQARVHREDTEFMGVDKASVSKKIGTSQRRIRGCSSIIITKGSQGPGGGVVISVRDITDARKGQSMKLLYGPGSAIVGSAVQSYAITGMSVAPKPDLFNTSSTPQWNQSKEQPQTKVAPGSGTFTETTKPQYPTCDAPAVKKQAVSKTWRAYEVIERYTRRAKFKVDLPIEEAIHPPWIWDGWRDLKIGETYMQFFGTNSITDIEGYSTDLSSLLAVDDEVEEALEEEQEGLENGTKQKPETEDEFFARIMSEAEIKTSQPDDAIPNATNKSEPDTAGAEEADKKVNSLSILVMEQERTIEASIDYLVRVYSFIKHYGMDVGEFIRNYGWRPIATMVQILGSENFNIQPKTQLEMSGSLSDPELLKEKTIDGEYVITGREGFHSRAFGDVEDLFGLVDPKVKNVLGLSKGKGNAVSKKLDVRRRRRQTVWDYVYEITSSRGLLG